MCVYLITLDLSSLVGFCFVSRGLQVMMFDDYQVSFSRLQCAIYDLLLYMWQATKSYLDECPEDENWKKIHWQPCNNWCKFICCWQITIGSTALIICCQPTDMSDIKFSSWKFFSIWKVCYCCFCQFSWNDVTSQWKKISLKQVLLYSCLESWDPFPQCKLTTSMLLQWAVLTLHLFWFAVLDVNSLLLL